MADDFAERVHAPTPRRRQTARASGEVVVSHDVGRVVTMVAGVSSVVGFAPTTLGSLVALTRRHLGEVPHWETDVASWTSHAGEIALELGKAFGPMLAVIFLVPIAVHLVQTRFLFHVDSAAADLDRVNPVAGMQRMISATHSRRTGLGMVAAVVMVAMTSRYFYGNCDAILGMMAMEVGAMAVFLCRSLAILIAQIAGALCVVAACDYAMAWWRHERSLRMTTQEMRDELRSQEGDPQTAARRRARRQQFASSALPE